jgi:hypothetical protein
MKKKVKKNQAMQSTKHNHQRTTNRDDSILGRNSMVGSSMVGSMVGSSMVAAW